MTYSGTMRNGLFALFLSISLPFTLFAQTHIRQMSYQGIIREGEKVPPDGSYTMTFAFYTSISSSQPIWSETQEIKVQGGLFNAFLGEKNILPEHIPSTIWVGTRLGNEPEFSRTKLTSVPYALSAASAQSLSADAKGAVLSLNGQQGNVQIQGRDGLEIRSDVNGGLVVGFTDDKKNENVQNQGTEWLLAGNSNASSSSWLGTSNNFPLIVKTNNTERMRILSSGTGNVGIGETTPGSRLTVARTLHLTNTGGAPELKLSAASGSNSTTFKTSIQNANIVYTLPSDNGEAGDVLSTDGSGELTWEAPGWSMNGNNNGSSTRFLGTTNAQPIIVKTNNTERLRITSSGTLGIGEDSPTQKLEVVGNILVKADGSGTGEFRIQESGNGVGNNYTGFRSGNMPVNITYTLPTAPPLADQVLTSNAQGILSWETPSSGSMGSAGGDLTGTYPNPQIATGVIVNADINSSAAIDYGKLNLNGSIVNSDIHNSAGISYSKLNLLGGIVDSDIDSNAGITYGKLNLSDGIIDSDINSSAGIVYSKLNLSDGIIDSDINSSAGIVYSKLNLSDGIVDADVNTSAGIVYSKLNLSDGIVDSDVNSSAGISYSKLNLSDGIIDSDINSSAGIAYSKLNLSDGIVDSDVNSSAGIAYSKLNLSDGIIDSDINSSAGISYSKLNLSDGIIDSDINSSAGISYSKLNLSDGIVDADINSSAGIAYSKLNLSNSIVAGDIVDGSITGTKIAMGSDSTGDIMYYDGSEYTRLTIGAQDQMLRVSSSGIPEWANGSSIILPDSSTHNAITRFNGVTGTAISNSALIIDDFSTDFQTNVTLRAYHDTTADISLVLSPRGAGALMANKPDFTMYGGNSRGFNAVDFQMMRMDSSQVASGMFSVISGGNSNLAQGEYAVVSGGLTNTILEDLSVIAGGVGNTITSDFSVISGGVANTITIGESAVISGGTLNIVSEDYSVISGGISNEVSGYASVVSGGQTNEIEGELSVISGGEYNYIDGDFSIVSGGNGNETCAYASVVSGGDYNSICGDSSVISGGAMNSVGGSQSVISGGSINTVEGYQSVVSGGYLNTVLGSQSAISGGSMNMIDSTHSVISGGTMNTIYSSQSVISGGSTNIITNNQSVISGGSTNTVNGMQSVISGGFMNTINGDFSTIAGGRGLTFVGNGNFGFMSLNPALDSMIVTTDNTSVFANTNLWLANNDSTAREIRFYEAKTGSGDFPNGANYTAFKAQEQSSDITYTLPAEAPATEGQVLSSEMDGTMSWRVKSMKLTVSGYDPASVSATTFDNFVISVAGILSDDVVQVNRIGGFEDLIIASVSVSNPDEITIRVYNPTGGAVDLNSADLMIGVIR